VEPLQRDNINKNRFGSSNALEDWKRLSEVARSFLADQERNSAALASVKTSEVKSRK
jgi:hypothetical protein